MGQTSTTTQTPHISARLLLVFVASLVPVAAATALGQFWPVPATAVVVSAFGAGLGWFRGGAPRWRDAAWVAALATVVALSDPVMGVWTLTGGLCSVLLLRERRLEMPWLSWGQRRWWVGFLVATAVGGSLGVLNLVSARQSGDTERIGAGLSGILDAVQAGISEELGMRLCLLAICIYVIGRPPRTRVEHLLTYAILTMPHAAIHFIQSPDLMLSGTITLGLVFGAPLAFLLKRFGVGSAIWSHTMIDAMRWRALGG